MKLVFMGTPDFAVPSLEALLAAGHSVCAVYSQPDRPSGRGHRLQAPPVKALALAQGIPVYQPEKLRDGTVAAQLRAFEPDAIIVVAYGRILPKEILDIPKYGCINVHGSLLPKYRGAAPIQWAVLNGDKTSGVSTMYLAEGMDTGDILLQAETEIAPGETAGGLFERLKTMGAALLVETLRQLEAGTLSATPQQEEAATYAPMLKKEDARVDWSRHAQALCHMIHGMYPWPCAYTEIDGKKLKLIAAECWDGSGAPGTVLAAGGDFVVCCGTGALRLLQVQPENKRVMSGKDYLLGHPFEKGKKLS